MPLLTQTTLHGFARVTEHRVRIATARRVGDVQEIIAYARSTGDTVCPRGHGCSYGDQAIDDHGIVVDTSAMNEVLSFDEEAGLVTVQPGIQLMALLRTIFPAGWMVTALPGGLKITVGGALANNVHGKDCWKNGNFSENVLRLKMVTADGAERVIDRNSQPELFRSIIGGMGLLGVVTEITLRLNRIPSPFVNVHTWPVRNLREMGRFLRDLGPADDFAVGWLDGFARGQALGRGSAEVARWTDSRTRIDASAVRELMQAHDKVLGVFPADPTWALLRHFFFHGAVRYANAAKYLVARTQRRVTRTVFFPEFLWMIDKVIPEFNKLLLPRGFASLQPLVPMDDDLENVATLLRACHEAACEPILCSVKRHRPDSHPLSFAGDGVSFNIDIPLKGKSEHHVRTLVDRLYRLICDMRGRVYLAKDIYLSGERFRAMYPDSPTFTTCKSAIDPDGIFSSNMYRRLTGP